MKCIFILTDRSAIKKDIGMAPKIVDKQKKRSQIIESAIRVFARFGLANTRMIQIAEAAGIGKGTIYEYFPSKEELFVAAFRAFADNADRQIAKRIRKLDDPVEKLRSYFTAWVDVLDKDLLEYADLMIDIWSEGIRLHQGKDIFDLKGVYRKFMITIKEILDEGVVKEMFVPMDTTMVAHVLIATMDGLYIQYVMDKDVFDIHQAIHEMAEIMLRGIRKTNS